MRIGFRCPKCSRQVQSTMGTEYRCVNRGETFDSVDIFLPLSGDRPAVGGT
jgi:DNA-directed RNA polymerase subunit RPC12/RpoP